MNTESVDCCHITNLPLPAGFKTKPGDFAWDTDFYPPPPEGDTQAPHRVLYLHLPGDGEGWDAIRVRLGAPGGERVWGWDGNMEKPTLEPSIHWIGRWHGFLKAGRLVSC